MKERLIGLWTCLISNRFCLRRRRTTRHRQCAKNQPYPATHNTCRAWRAWRACRDTACVGTFKRCTRRHHSVAIQHCGGPEVIKRMLFCGMFWARTLQIGKVSTRSWHSNTVRPDAMTLPIRLNGSATRQTKGACDIKARVSASMACCLRYILPHVLTFYRSLGHFKPSYVFGFIGYALF